MKSLLFVALPLMAAFMMWRVGIRMPAEVPQKSPVYLNCGALEDRLIDAAADGKFIPLIPGMGKHHFAITTNSDSAQLYFDQGLNFYYSYHFRESRASFKEAQKFDAASPMPLWGEALASGPYYNNYEYHMPPTLPSLVTRMSDLAHTANEKEQALTEAMKVRYAANDSLREVSQADQLYAMALKALMVKYPLDDDLKALYIDAVMLQHKWDFWHSDGSPQPWTIEVVDICKQILDHNATHPAAMHYYIHLTEASRHPELALPAAESLRIAMPGVGHMVHMATHSYQRNGLYAKGVNVNEDANTVNNAVDMLAPNLGIGQNKVIHIFAVQAFCALNGAMYKDGMPVYNRARERVVAVTPNMSADLYAQEVFMQPAIALVRLGKWDELLQLEQPDSTWINAQALNDFCRGMAEARLHRASEATTHLNHLQTLLTNESLAVKQLPFNSPAEREQIAAGILAAAIQFEKGARGQAIATLKQTVHLEDTLVYREPQQWQLPVRHYLGDYLLQMKKPKQALKVFNEDLALNPGNGWALAGLSQCYTMLKDVKKQKRYTTLRGMAFAASDLKPHRAAF
jgi:tetratricopeptide (TPR) repeat protein